MDQARGAIVLIHGVSEHSGRLGNLMTGLALRGFSVFAIDLRGHGRSEDAAGKRVHVERFDDFLEDVDRALSWAREQEPDKPLFLLGHSMGGLIVLRHGLLRSDAGLLGRIALAPALRLPLWKEVGVRMVVLPLVALTGGRFHIGRTRMTLNAVGKALSRDSQVAAAFRSDALVHVPLTLRLIAEIFRAGRDAMDRAAEQSGPLLMLHGRGDRITNPEGSRRFREFRARYTTTCFYAGAMHELHNELEATRAEVVDDIVRWIEDRLTFGADG